MATPRAALMLVSSRDWMSQPASVRSRSMVWRARSSGVMGMDGKGDYSASGEYEGGLMLRGLRRQAPATVRPLRLGRRKKQVPHTVRKRRERVRDDNRTTNGNGMGPKSRSLTPFASDASGFGMTTGRPTATAWGRKADPSHRSQTPRTGSGGQQSDQRKRRDRVRDDNRAPNGNGVGPQSRSLTPFANDASGFGMTTGRPTATAWAR